MRGCYHVNYKMFSTHGSRWCGAVIMWIIICSLHTAAADEGLLSCEWEVVPYTRQPLMRGWYPVNEWGAKWLCFANSRTPLWGGGCMLTQWVFPCGICGDVRYLCSRICLRREKPGWCLVLQVRRWEECGHLVDTSSSPESRRSTADQRADGLPLRKCHTHLNAAEEQPWGLPSNERTLTVSCNSLSHNLGSAKWRKRFWRNCRGRHIYTASRARICMLRDNWPVIWTGVSQ